MVDESGVRRRSRRRATAREGPPRPPSVPEPETVAEPAQHEPASEPPRRERLAPRDKREKRTQPAGTSAGKPAAGKPAAGKPAAGKAARGDRDLAGPGSSQVGPTGAMRARDLNRPTPEDLAEAEAELDIVRRHWTPTTDPPETRPARRRRS